MEDTKTYPLIQYRSVWFDGWAEGFGYDGCQMIVDKEMDMFDVSPHEVSNFSPLWCHGNLLCNRHLWCANVHHCVATCMHLMINQRWRNVGKQEDHASVMSCLWKSSSGWSPRPRYCIYVFHVFLFCLEASIEIWPHSTDKARLYPDWNVNVTQAGFRDFWEHMLAFCHWCWGLWEWSCGPMWCSRVQEFFKLSRLHRCRA